MNDMFNTYKKNILCEVHEYSPESDSVEGILLNQNLEIIGYAGIICILFSLYCLYGIFTGIIGEAYNMETISAIIICLVSSGYMVCLFKNKKLHNNLKLIRISIIFYYMCINLAVFIFSYSLNTHALEAGMNSSFMGIPLPSVLLIIFLVAPLNAISDSVLVLGSMSVFTAILAFINGHDMFNLSIQISFRIIVILGYFHTRSRNYKQAKREINAHTMQDKLMQSSYVDNLTGVLNRHALDMFIHHMNQIKGSVEISAIMLDVDFFKLYNDNYTHKEGDTALIKVASALSDSLNENCPYIFRFGGEEFIIFAMNQSDESLVQFGLDCRQAIKNLNIPRKDASPFDHLTISLGCSHVDLKQNSLLDDYIFQADIQLYLSKHSGRDCVSFGHNVFR